MTARWRSWSIRSKYCHGITSCAAAAFHDRPAHGSEHFGGRHPAVLLGDEEQPSPFNETVKAFLVADHGVGFGILTEIENASRILRRVRDQSLALHRREHVLERVLVVIEVVGLTSAFLDARARRRPLPFFLQVGSGAHQE